MVTEERKKVKNRKMAFSFEGYMKQLLRDVRGTSKMHRIDITTMSADTSMDPNNNQRVFIFYVNGKYHTTHADGTVIINDFLKRNGRVNRTTMKIITQRISPKIIHDIDPGFENDELEVFDVDLLKGEIINDIMAGSRPWSEDDGEKKINFYNDENEEGMFTSVDVSEGYLFDQNEETCVSTFQPYTDDWTNEMVDSVIGNMFDYEESKDCSTKNEVIDRFEPEDNKDFVSIYSKDDKTNQASSRPFVCHFKQCNRAFKRFEHLKRHYRIHTGERPFKCKFPGCHKAFARSDNLNQHMRVHNTGHMPQNHANVRNIRYLDDNN